MSIPAVSVVIPFFNRAESILPAIESVLGQTFHDLELILVDDASTDGSLTALDTLKDERIRLLRHETNKGAGAARNTGIAAARADWVAFQDSDDLWAPEKLARQMARLSSPEDGFVAAYCGMLIEDMEDPGREPRYFPGLEIGPREGNILDALLKRSFISTQTLVARRDLLQQIGGFDPEMPALIDWECMLRLAPLGPVAFVDEPLVRQRFSENSITRSAKRRLQARLRLLEKHHDLLARKPGVLAAHHYVIAGALRRSGEREDLAKAQSHLSAAIRLAPQRLSYRAMAAWLQCLQVLPRRGQAA